jgi:hypothetical protein
LVVSKIFLLGAGVFCNSFGSLADGVLGEFSGEKKTNSGLNFSAGDGASLVVVSEARSFGGDSLEDVVDEGVHDTHSLGADSGIGVNLLQNLVNVDGIGFLPPLLLLFLVTFRDVFLGFSRFFGGLTGSSGRHYSEIIRKFLQNNAIIEIAAATISKDLIKAHLRKYCFYLMLVRMLSTRELIGSQVCQ